MYTIVIDKDMLEYHLAKHGLAIYDLEHGASIYRALRTGRVASLRPIIATANQLAIDPLILLKSVANGQRP